MGNKKKKFYLLRVHVEFLPSHSYLLISLCSFATEKKKKQQPVISYSFTKTTTSGTSFNLYFGYFVFSITKTRHSLFIRGKIMLLFSILSSNCSFRELYHYQLDSLEHYILSNIFSIQMNGTPGQDSQALDWIKVIQCLFSMIKLFICYPWRTCSKVLLNHVHKVALLTFLLH